MMIPPPLKCHTGTDNLSFSSRPDRSPLPTGLRTESQFENPSALGSHSFRLGELGWRRG